MQVDNSVSVTGGRPNAVRTMTPQNVFSHTSPTIQPGVNNELVHFVGDLGGTVHPSSTVTDLPRQGHSRDFYWWRRHMT